MSVGPIYCSVHRGCVAFYSPNIGIARTCLEGLHVILGQVLGRHHGIKVVSVSGLPVLQVVRHEMLACGNDLFDRRIVTTLKPVDESSNVGFEMESIFSWCFLSSAPSWVPAM